MEPTCGLISSANKIVGGSAAGLSEFPWMALIGYETSKYLTNFENLYRSRISIAFIVTMCHLKFIKHF